MNRSIKGFSKLSKAAKIEWLIANYADDAAQLKPILEQYWNADEALQKRHEEFAENTLTNFYMPFGVAPNFLIDGELYTLPMVIEESSVVAGASKAALYWQARGGFKTELLGLEKTGQVHFLYEGAADKLKAFFERVRHRFFEDTDALTRNMRARRGGITRVELLDKTDLKPHYYQLCAHFNTVDSMGANLINSCLEQFARTLESELHAAASFTARERAIQVIMCIVSNYTPECLVRAEVCCPIEALTEDSGLSSSAFAEKFRQAVDIAQIDPYRAVTHNKGIMNGVDAVVIATGNDFRAVEADAHAYAARDGQYRSLSHVELCDGQFRFWLDLPLSVGTVGGLTSLHPLVKFALKMLGNPKAPKLMGIIAAAGLAQNFAAVRSLVTTGIQKGHMKMHLLNILNQLRVLDSQKSYFIDYFQDKTVTYAAVEKELECLCSAMGK